MNGDNVTNQGSEVEFPIGAGNSLDDIVFWIVTQKQHGLAGLAQIAISQFPRRHVDRVRNQRRVFRPSKADGSGCRSLKLLRTIHPAGDDPLKRNRVWAGRLRGREDPFGVCGNRPRNNLCCAGRKGFWPGRVDLVSPLRRVCHGC